MQIAFLGTGQMGAAIARRLHIAGHRVMVWNRTPQKAAALAEEGLTIASCIESALEEAEVTFSMLTDDAAMEQVILGDHGAISLIPSGGIHVSLSTLSVSLSQRLTIEHLARRQHFVAAPVFGRPPVAEAGKLWIAMAGESSIVEKVKPVLQAASRGISVVGTEPCKAHALKLGGNFLITAMIQSLSEAFVFASSQRIDPGLFLEAVNNALFQSPFYANYANVMLHPPEQVGASVAIGVKDTRLFREAAGMQGLQLHLADYFAQQLHSAVEAGLKDEDWAVAQYRMVQSSLPVQS
jgi:3-hydroxyisobutyrate dehydrogenase-like beta-hydroxyacid dehydrogenase